jgi:NhaP-type Na+/H+ or K+/H+ antiporter
LGVAFVGEILSSLFSDPVVETILTVVVVFGSYALATGVGASGLVAVSVAGIYYGSYTMRTAMDQKEREAVSMFWQIIAFIGNTVAFLLIGFQANLLALPQSLLLVVLAYLAVTIGRAATVYPILHFFRKKIGDKNLGIWSNIAMLGGARGAVSIALASTITASAVITQNDIKIVNTMVFGVAFISIMIQVPLLVRYAHKKLSTYDKERATELHQDYQAIEAAIIEVNTMKAEGKISHEEVDEKIDKLKTELNHIMCESSASLQTKKIIQERATTLFTSIPKLAMPIPMPHQKNKSKKDKTEKEQKHDSNET